MSKDSRIEQTEGGARCQVCMSDDGNLNNIKQIPKKYLVEWSDSPELIVCDECESSLNKIFNTEFFELLSIYVNNDDVYQVDDHPLKKSENESSERQKEPQGQEKRTSCKICGEFDPRTLEEHHVIPRRYLFSPQNPLETVTLCSNCHKKIEGLYDDEFFSRVGFNTGIRSDEVPSNHPDAQTLPTVREMTERFVEEMCIEAPDEALRSGEFMRVFSNYLQDKGYEYRGDNAVVFKAIADAADYAEWSSSEDLKDTRHYWRSRRLKNIHIDGADHIPSFDSSGPYEF